MPDYKKQQQQIKETTDKLEAGIREFLSSDKFQEYLKVMSRFHNYSYSNSLLIAMQKPDATLVAGFSKWKSMERHPMRGEHGIKIFAPAPVKEKETHEKIDPDTKLPILDENGNPVIEEIEIKRPRFKVVTVFDVSQTDGKPLPDLEVNELKGSVNNFPQFFEALKRTSKVPIDLEPMEGSKYGYFSPLEKRIAIREGISETQMIKTAVHELAHSRLHDIDETTNPSSKLPTKDRETKEVEAESVAYTVCQHFGIDTGDYSFGYVASWSSGRELPELKSSLSTIRSAASSLINEIEENLITIQKEQVKEAENIQESPKGIWHYYIIPDLMTWAKPTPEQERSKLESFTTFEQAAARFHELRNSPYNKGSAINEDTQIPYARLTFGMQCDNPLSTVDLLHVRNNQNVLSEDFTHLTPDPAVTDTLSRLASEIGFQQVLHHRQMTPEEIKDFTRAHLIDQMRQSNLTEQQQQSYLDNFELVYESGQLDSLKPSSNQQSITELINFSDWENSYFEVSDSIERFSADLDLFASTYDPYEYADTNDGNSTYSDIYKSLSEGKVDYLKDWLSSIAQEESEYSKEASVLIQRLDKLTVASEENKAIDMPVSESVQQKPLLEPQEAVYQIDRKYLQMQRASDESWDYTIYDSQLHNLDGGQIGDSSMSLSQARNEIIAFHNLSDNVPLTDIPAEQFSEMLEQREHDLKCPIYPYSLMDARSRGELDEWRKSHNATCECAHQFQTDYWRSYEDRKVPEFLNSMFDRYGMDRVKIVLASNIQLASHDGRYHPEVKEAAAKIIVPEANPDSSHDRRMDYLVTCHPVTLDVAMKEILKIEAERSSAHNVKRLDQRQKIQDKISLTDKPKSRTSILAKLHANQKSIAEKDAKIRKPDRDKPEL